MRHYFYLGILLPFFSSILLAASSQVNPPDAHKSALPPNPMPVSESLAVVCSEKNPPPCATPPRVISGQTTLFSRKAGTNIAGLCVLSVIVEPDGHTSHIHVTKGLSMDLDEEAISAVKNWKFKPAMLNGKPVAVQIAVEVAFNIR